MIKIPGDEEAQLRLTGLIKTVLFLRQQFKTFSIGNLNPCKKTLITVTSFVRRDLNLSNRSRNYVVRSV